MAGAALMMADSQISKMSSEIYESSRKPVDNDSILPVLAS
jgi:hypothetical protein